MSNLLGKRALICLFLSVILITHVFILTKLIYFPYPELFIYPYLVNHGLKPYSQILDQHFPGLMFFPINLDNLGMNTPEVARLWSVLIVIIIQLMLFFIGSKILKSKSKALLVNLLFLIWNPFFEGWVLWIDSFLPLLLLPAFYALYERKIFVTGLFLGIAVVFKQTVIPLSILVLLYVFLTTRDIKASIIFLLGLFVPVALMIAYFLRIGVWQDFWYWTVVFNLTTYAQLGRGAGPTLAHFSRVFLVFGSVFLLLIFTKLKARQEQLLLIFLLGALLGLSTRFDFVHFQPALPFALLATVYGLRFSRGSKNQQTRSGRLAIIGMLGYFLISFWWLVIFYKGHLGNRVITFDSQTKDLAVKIRGYTNPGEKIFVYGVAPHLYQMSNTLPAGDIFVFQFPWFLKVSQNRILEGIMRDKPEIIVSDRTVIIEGAKIIDFASDIDQYISRNYQKIDNIGTADILRRKK